MKRLSLFVVLAIPAVAQWTVVDPTNLQQAILLYQQVQAYKQIAENMAAFAHNPAQFMAQLASVEQIALNTAVSAGVTTAQRATELQQLIILQRQAMQEAQTMSTISHGNMGAIGQWAMSMQETSQELAATNAQLKHEQRVAYYQQHNTYQPQAAVISGWRLK